MTDIDHHGEHLQSRGDPRGELIAIDLQTRSLLDDFVLGSVLGGAM